MLNENHKFHHFATEKQAEYESDLLIRFGDKVKEHIEQSNQNIKGWTMQNWDQASQEFTAICKDLTLLLEKNIPRILPKSKKLLRAIMFGLNSFGCPTKNHMPGLRKGMNKKNGKKHLSLIILSLPIIYRKRCNYLHKNYEIKI